MNLAVEGIFRGDDGSDGSCRVIATIFGEYTFAK